MKLLSIYISEPKPLSFNGQTVMSGIAKTRVSGPVQVIKNRIVGDGQGETSVHGGVNKAIYAYSSEAYDWWKSHLGVSTLRDSAFGENLLVEALDEKAVFIGDLWTIGSAVLEVSEPRFPCSRLGMYWQDMSIIKKFAQSERPGVYLRVIKEGEIRSGESVSIESPEVVKFSISEMATYYYSKKIERSRYEELTNVRALSDRWKEKLKLML